MTDLATWLLEQIAEDERRAQAAIVATRHMDEPAGAAKWRVVDGGLYAGMTELAIAGYGGYLDERFTDHATAWDPARVLADCSAKREIIDVTRGTYSADLVQRLMALPYSERPGYREEWRP